ncbi:MAG: hypothetical protein Q9184_005570 [Pyrenodesmia sp. 2 TL-2023]
MSFQSQFSLSLELAKVFPVRQIVQIGTEQIVSLVRALRKDGSDFLVEEDLANIFGRGRIEPSLEADFRKVVRIGSIQPLHADSPIYLDSGPGATVRRALKDHFYMSSVIQLSFLMWIHEETSLAAALVESMLSRYFSEVQGATPDPDYDGIFKTLQACSSQTSQYPWENLCALVQTRFPNSIRWFDVEHSPLKSLSPNLLLGAMDYLYMAQSLPEDRLVMVDNPRGLVPMVIWAHYILGLTVLIKDSPDGDVGFGPMESPQVIIKWDSERSLNPFHLDEQGFTSSDSLMRSPPPDIYLLDAEMHVLLRTEPKDNDGVEIQGQEIHRLKGYGTTFLQRLFNTHSLLDDDDPLFADTANFAVSIAILLSRRMRRSSHDSGPFHQKEDPKQYYFNTAHWRLFNSSHVLFWRIKLDKRKIIGQLDKLNGKSLYEMAMPTSLKNYISKLEEPSYGLERHAIACREHESFLIENIQKLASWIVAFGQVIDIESCHDLPLRILPNSMTEADALSLNLSNDVDIDSYFCFDLIRNMMRKDPPLETQSITKAGNRSSARSESLFLTCHQGWSLFHSSLGDKDPEHIICELLCIKQGVPTNTRTGERRNRITDAPSISSTQKGPALLNNEDSYVPRCATKVYKRTEHYSSRSNEFWLSIRYDVEDLEFNCRTSSQRRGATQKYSLYASYSAFHHALWSVMKTVPCTHQNEDGRSLSLGLDAQTVAGLYFQNVFSTFTRASTRIYIFLVKGDARARWLAVHGFGGPNCGLPNCGFRILLRCNDCCEDCAVKAASAMKGRWLVVL